MTRNKDVMVNPTLWNRARQQALREKLDYQLASKLFEYPPATNYHQLATELSKDILRGAMIFYLPSFLALIYITFNV